jgi:hypothetical protein
MPPIAEVNLEWTQLQASEYCCAVEGMQKELEVNQYNAIAHLYLSYPLTHSIPVFHRIVFPPF